MNLVDINTLQIETTNRCNLNCPHCMLYGEGESGSDYSDYMEPRTIDQFFNNNIRIIHNINFTGGEPLLNINIIIYTIDKIIRENKKVIGIDIATNGTILSGELIIALNRFTEYVTEKVLKDSTQFFDTFFEKGTEKLVNLRISRLYHKNDYEKAYRFYTERANPLVHVEIIGGDEAEESHRALWGIEDRKLIAYSGRAKKLDAEFYCDSPHHKIVYEDNSANIPLVKCPLELMSNGDIGISCYCTIEESHKDAIGNVNENISLSEMITRWNYQTPLNCDEACHLAEAKMYYETGRIEDMSRVLGKSITAEDLEKMLFKEEMKCALLENYRRLLHEKVPCLTPEEIEWISLYWYDLQEQVAKNEVSEDEIKKSYEEMDNYIADLIIKHEYEGITDIHEKYIYLTPTECKQVKECQNAIDHETDFWQLLAYKMILKKLIMINAERQLHDIEI